MADQCGGLRLDGVVGPESCMCDHCCGLGRAGMVGPESCMADHWGGVVGPEFFYGRPLWSMGDG